MTGDLFSSSAAVDQPPSSAAPSNCALMCFPFTSNEQSNSRTLNLPLLLMLEVTPPSIYSIGTDTFHPLLSST
jgi:hypothetical protein